MNFEISVDIGSVYRQALIMKGIIFNPRGFTRDHLINWGNSRFLRDHTNETQQMVKNILRSVGIIWIFSSFLMKTVSERNSSFWNDPIKIGWQQKFHRPANRFSRPASSIFFESIGRRNSPFARPGYRRWKWRFKDWLKTIKFKAFWRKIPWLLRNFTKIPWLFQVFPDFF